MSFCKTRYKHTLAISTLFLLSLESAYSECRLYSFRSQNVSGLMRVRGWENNFGRSKINNYNCKTIKSFPPIAVPDLLFWLKFHNQSRGGILHHLANFEADRYNFLNYNKIFSKNMNFRVPDMNLLNFLGRGFRHFETPWSITWTFIYWFL